jgi:hypothetical protein
MYRIKKLNKSNMYLPITQWLDQNSIPFPCGHNRRSNHVAPLSPPWHMLKLTLLLLIGPLPYILCFLITLLLLFIVGSLKNDMTLLLLTTRTP